MSRDPDGRGYRTAVEAVVRGMRYWWIAPLVLGFLPALLLSKVLLGWVSAADWSCTGVEFGASGSRYGGCSTIAGELVVAVAVSWLVPIVVLAALLYFRRRAPARARTEADRAGTFVKVVAVLVGLANAFAIGDVADVVGAPSERPLATLFGTLLLSVPAGLAASGLVSRRWRSALDEGFLIRYSVAVLGFCLGGAILGGSSWVLGVIVNYQPGLPQGPESGIFLLLYATLAYGAIAALVGGVLGLLEGLVLGLPLAAVLGWLRRPPQRSGTDAPFPNTA